MFENFYNYLNRYMYWTDWGKLPKIQRADMDGSNRTVLVDKNLGWPNGIVIDKQSQRIVWADAKMEVIESSDLNGGNRRVIISNVNHPYGLTITDRHIYWTDWQKMAIFKADKDTGSNLLVIRRTLPGLMDLQAVIRSPDGKSIVITIQLTCKDVTDLERQSRVRVIYIWHFDFVMVAFSY